MNDPQALKQEILRLTREYSRQVHASFRPAVDPQRQAWQEGTTIPYAGRVFTEDEVEAAVGSTLDFWLTLGAEGEAFQKELAAFLGVRHSLLVNSGSSANLVAISVLTSAKLPEARRIKPGDEVITVAAGFPTTVAPIVQVGAVPVFIDADPITGNARCDQLEAAYRAGKTKAVMMAHALGNPFDLAAMRFVVCDQGSDIYICQTISISEAKGFILHIILYTLEATTRHCGFASINKGNFPGLRFFMMNLHRINTHMEGYVAHMQEIISKIFLDHITFVSTANHEFVNAMSTIDL